MKVEYNYTRQQSYAVYNFLVKIQKETSELVNGSFFVFFCFLRLLILGKTSHSSGVKGLLPASKVCLFCTPLGTE